MDSGFAGTDILHFSRWTISVQILCKDPRTVAAGGAAELEVAKQLTQFGKKETGLDQYAIAKFAEALEV